MHVIKTALYNTLTHTQAHKHRHAYIYTHIRGGVGGCHTHMQVTGKLIAHFVSVVVVVATLPCAVALLP